MPRRYTIKQLPQELRPRERLLAAGPSALSDVELLGLLFGIGSRKKTAVKLAQTVISEAGGHPSDSFCRPNSVKVRSEKAAQILWLPGPIPTALGDNPRWKAIGLSVSHRGGSAPRCTTRSTKGFKIAFRIMLTAGAPEVRLERWRRTHRDPPALGPLGKDK